MKTNISLQNNILKYILLKCEWFFSMSIGELFYDLLLFNSPWDTVRFVKEKLPGSGDVELQCPKCSDVWEEEELVEKCNMSEDEKLFLNCVLEVNEKTKKMKQWNL